MFRCQLLIAVAFALLTAVPASAQQPSNGAVAVKDAWSRATAGGAKTGAAYVTLVNEGSATDRLVAASSPVAGKVELHTMSMEGDVMRMRQVQSVEVNAGGKVELKPGGLHIMLLDLKAPLKEGQRFPLSLAFEKAGESTIEVEVKSIGASGPTAPMHH